MITGRNGIALAATMMVMCGFCCGTNAQDLWNHYSDTSPQATPIPLMPRKHAVPITPAEEAEGGIIWGAGREVQLGLRTRLLVRGERPGRFIFDVYLRNKTDRTLTVECPSNTTGDQSDRVYCSPTMEDSHGKPVDMDLRQGADTHRFSLAPGQFVLISHWMLRTASIKAQNPGRKGQSQTAYVSPGSYTMNCSIRADWGGQSTELRTGKIPFEVLKSDVEDARVAHSP